MINLLNAVPAAVDSQGALAALSADAPVDGMPLFSLALAKYFVGQDGAVAGLPAAGASTPGKDALTGAPVPADQAGSPQEADPAATLLAMLGLPVVVPSASPVAGSASGDVAASGVSAGAGADIELTLSVVAESESDPGDPASANEGGQERPLFGKKLPPALANLAALRRESESDTEVTGVKSVSGEARVEPLLTAFRNTASTQEIVLPASSERPVAVTPQAGHEASMLTLRTHMSAATDKPVLMMQNTMGGTAWQQELGERVVWLSGRQGQMAELVLNPPSLGAVEVRLSLNGGEASAQFFSANPQVRESIESALPKLREMMDGAGISLGEATVSDRSFGGRDESTAESGARGEAGRESGSGEFGQVVVSRVSGGRSLLDYYA